MGSSFSVVNDTDHEVGVKVGCCKAALAGTLGALAVVGSVATAGIGAAALAGVGVGATGLTMGVGAAASATLGGSAALVSAIRQLDCEVLKPGGERIVKGTLSLCQDVVVVSGYGVKERVCWTGPTDGSHHTYTVSEHFRF